MWVARLCRPITGGRCEVVGVAILNGPESHAVPDGMTSALYVGPPNLGTVL
jgi:hypothetical protein